MFNLLEFHRQAVPHNFGYSSAHAQHYPPAPFYQPNVVADPRRNLLKLFASVLSKSFETYKLQLLESFQSKRLKTNCCVFPQSKIKTICQPSACLNGKTSLRQSNSPQAVTQTPVTPNSCQSPVCNRNSVSGHNKNSKIFIASSVSANARTRTKMLRKSKKKLIEAQQLLGSHLLPYADIPLCMSHLKHFNAKRIELLLRRLDKAKC